MTKLVMVSLWLVPVWAFAFWGRERTLGEGMRWRHAFLWGAVASSALAVWFAVRGCPPSLRAVAA